MSSAVPIHPMLRLARRHAAAAASGSVSSASATTAAEYVRRGQRLFTSSSVAHAKRASSKSTGSVTAAAGPSSTTTTSSVQDATKGSYVPPSAKAAETASTSKGGGPLFSAENFAKESAALRAYAASVRGKPRSPPPKIKLTDSRSEEHKKQSQQQSQEQAADEKNVATVRAKGKASETARDPASTLAASEADPPPPAGAQTMLNKEAQPSASNVEAESKREEQQAEQPSAGTSTNPLAEGVIIHATSANRQGDFGSRDASSHDSSSSASDSSSSSSGAAGGSSATSTSSNSDVEEGGSTALGGGSGGSGDGGSPPIEGEPVSDVGADQPPQLLHPFDTHNFVKRLQEAHFTRKLPMPSADEQETTSLVHGHRHDPAEAIMGALRHLLVNHGDFILDSHINKTEMENQSYLFSAALAELRTELQVRARNDAAALRSMVTLLQREVDALNQRMREDVASMKHDIQVDMNNRKSEAKDEQNTLEQEIQDLNNRFTISISDLKTEIEQSIKWDATRRALTLFFGSIVIIIATLALADYLTRDLEKDEGGNASSKRDGNAGNASRNAHGGPGSQGTQQQIVENRPRSAEELGVLPQYDDEQVGRLA